MIFPVIGKKKIVMRFRNIDWASDIDICATMGENVAWTSQPFLAIGKRRSADTRSN